MTKRKKQKNVMEEKRWLGEQLKKTYHIPSTNYREIYDTQGRKRKIFLESYGKNQRKL